MNRSEEIRRRIFLKHQLIEATKKEIEALESDLKRVEGSTEVKHEPS